MNRVSTAGSYRSALLNLMSAQSQQFEAQTRVSTRKVATDSAGYGRAAESLTTLRSAQARVQGFLDTGNTVAARLTTQDIALNQIADGIVGARAAIGNALANGTVNNLMLELQGQFQSIQNGLNSEHHGTYVFAGGNGSQAPVAVATLAELAAAPDVASTFTNDRLATVSRLGESASVTTGYLASDIGTAAFEVFRAIQTYSDDPTTGPLTGTPTEAQRAFLSDQLGKLDAARASVTEIAARNGSIQKQIETLTASHAAQVASLDQLVANKTDVDLAQALTDLQLSQVAVEASAQVISQLSQISLLNFLR